MNNEEKEKLTTILTDKFLEWFINTGEHEDNRPAVQNCVLDALDELENGTKPITYEFCEQR